MPANLTPQYHKAEQAYRQASTPQEELACLELMLREIPKHKGTDKLQAELKHKISRLREDSERQKKTSAGRPSSRIPRQGAGRILIIGGPNAGKSSLLAALTKATPEIGDYPFTTREPLPGMMPWEDLQVQLIDTPPITADVCEPETVGLVRGADAALLLVDLGDDDGGSALEAVLRQFGESKTRLGPETTVDESDVGTTYTRTLLVANKSDLPDAADRLAFFGELFPDGWTLFEVSCKTGAGLDPLRAVIFDSCNSVRVYTKQPHLKKPDMDKPFALKKGSTVVELAELIHRDLADSLKSARIWRGNAHDAISVKPDHELADRDIVELVCG
jgi:uncharacterized protein